ncbi:MAG: class I SAM-dependent methyltransferase [Acidobacteria bacterium]|nr:class I SAM-dependent methyltransferase [Acidobacteriota bacterium]
MLARILPYMRCPRCAAERLERCPDGLSCPACGSAFASQDGILDMIGEDPGEVITPFQRLMQSRAVVSVYESPWRHLGYFVASSRSFSREMETVLSLAGERGDGPALDLACGPGVFTRPLARRSRGIVIGLDLSRPMLRQAARRIAEDGIPNIQLIRASAFALPFADGVFSHVNCCGALHLFDRPEKALAEIARVTRAAGGFSVQTTIRPERSAGFAYILERFIRFGFFDEAELRLLIRSHGFSIERDERHRISFTFLARRLSPDGHSPV